MTFNLVNYIPAIDCILIRQNRINRLLETNIN